MVPPATGTGTATSTSNKAPFYDVDDAQSTTSSLFPPPPPPAPPADPLYPLPSRQEQEEEEEEEEEEGGGNQRQQATAAATTDPQRLVHTSIKNSTSTSIDHGKNANRFRANLEALQEAYAADLQDSAVAVQEALRIARQQTEDAEALAVENDALKDTVSSLARIVEQRPLTNAHGQNCAQELLTMHQQLLESQQQVLMLEKQLASFRYTARSNINNDSINNDFMGGRGNNPLEYCNNFVYAERETRAKAVEGMLMQGIIKYSKQEPQHQQKQ